MQFFEKKCRMCTEKREINVYTDSISISLILAPNDFNLKGMAKYANPLLLIIDEWS